jgi:hypothetical protein
MTEIIEMVTELATAMFSVGTQLTTWIMANPLALIGVVLFVLVALIGGIRRLIVG